MRGVINTIAVWFASGGSPTSSRKKHLKTVKFVNTMLNKPRCTIPSITFTDEEFQAFDPDQDDPTVITIEIFDFAIMKILID